MILQKLVLALLCVSAGQMAAGEARTKAHKPKTVTYYTQPVYYANNGWAACYNRVNYFNALHQAPVHTRVWHCPPSYCDYHPYYSYGTSSSGNYVPQSRPRALQAAAAEGDSSARVVDGGEEPVIRISEEQARKCLPALAEKGAAVAYEPAQALEKPAKAEEGMGQINERIKSLNKELDNIQAQLNSLGKSLPADEKQ